MQMQVCSFSLPSCSELWKSHFVTVVKGILKCDPVSVETLPQAFYLSLRLVCDDWSLYEYYSHLSIPKIIK